jgi:hypothetical protein
MTSDKWPTSNLGSRPGAANGADASSDLATLLAKIGIRTESQGEWIRDAPGRIERACLTALYAERAVALEVCRVPHDRTASAADIGQLLDGIDKFEDYCRVLQPIAQGLLKAGCTLLFEERKKMLEEVRETRNDLVQLSRSFRRRMK